VTKPKKINPAVESAGWPAYAVVSSTGLVRQVERHRDALRCIWAVGESIVQGTVTFIAAPKRRKAGRKS
jgi:hypothetical protein